MQPAISTLFYGWEVKPKGFICSHISGQDPKSLMLNDVLVALCTTVPKYTFQGPLLLLTYLQDHHLYHLGLLTLLEHQSERSHEDRAGSSGCFFLGFQEKAMPREQSRAAPILARDDREPLGLQSH